MFVASFALFYFLPAFLFRVDLDLGTVSLEMAVFVTMPAFERELLVIQFLIMMLVPYFQFYCFQ